MRMGAKVKEASYDIYIYIYQMGELSQRSWRWRGQVFIGYTTHTVLDPWGRIRVPGTESYSITHSNTHWHVVQENLSFDLIIRDRERPSMERISFVTEISVLVSKNVLFVTKGGGI